MALMSSMSSKHVTIRASNASQKFQVKVQRNVKLPSLDAKMPPYYKLILHKGSNFNHQHVSKTVSNIIPNMSRLEANDKASEAFMTGHSLLRVCPQELAEDFNSQLTSKYVETTIEPVDFF
jgi:hypothetical protein